MGVEMSIHQVSVDDTLAETTGQWWQWVNDCRWWFQMFFIFTPIPGEMIQFDEHIVQMGWNHQLDEAFEVSNQLVQVLMLGKLTARPRKKWQLIVLS